MATKPRFQVSVDVEKCCDYLRARKSATYRELSQFLGRDIKGRDRYVLESAKRRLERTGIVFVTETGVGISRADHSQVASLSTTVAIAKVKRVGIRAKKRQRLVDIQSLSNEDRAAFMIGRAILGAINQAIRPSFRNAVVKAVNTEDGPLDTKQVLDLFNELRVSNGDRVQ